MISTYAPSVTISSGSIAPTGTISFAIKGELIKIPRKELRASLVNELGWFKSEDEEGDEDE